MGTVANPTVETVPVGYRFHPTDEELVSHYLVNKLNGHDDSSVIAEVDVCKFEPWHLPEFSKVKSDDREWFFFSSVGLKYASGNRCNRGTNGGYWKVTGRDRKIRKRGTNIVIGTKKTLVFYKGRVDKTNWVIHEYHAVAGPADKRRFVLCRLMDKADKKAEAEAEAEKKATTDRRIQDAYASQPELNSESISLAQSQAEDYDFPSLVQQSPVAVEQEPCFEDSTFPNADIGNEDGGVMAPPFEEEYDIDSLLESFLADDNQHMF